MIPKPIDSIDENDLENLIKNGVRESKVIEYKLSLPDEASQSKREFLADVSSFANTLGGDAIYGAREDNGLPVELVGLTISDIDKEVSRLENILRDGLFPRLPSLATHSVKLSNGNWVLIFRIRQSWLSPHRVIFNGHDKFYMRNSTGKYPMDVMELREAFLRAGAMSERLRLLRDQRLTIVEGKGFPVPMKDGGKLVLHIMPISALSNLSSIDIARHGLSLRTIAPIGAQGWSHTINLDGHITYTGEGGASRAYTAYHRNGVVEAVSTITLGFDESRRIFGSWNEIDVVSFLSLYLNKLREFAIEPPFYVFLSFVGFMGYEFLIDGRGLSGGRQLNDRHNILLPEVYLQDYGEDIPTAMKTTFDMLWNAFGYERSLNFDVDGNWKPIRA